MATGIPPKTKSVKQKIPVSITYDGKIDADKFWKVHTLNLKKL